MQDKKNTNTQEQELKQIESNLTTLIKALPEDLKEKLGTQKTIDAINLPTQNVTAANAFQKKFYIKLLDQMIKDLTSNDSWIPVDLSVFNTDSSKKSIKTIYIKGLKDRLEWLNKQTKTLDSGFKEIILKDIANYNTILNFDKITALYKSVLKKAERITRTLEAQPSNLSDKEKGRRIAARKMLISSGLTDIKTLTEQIGCVEEGIEHLPSLFKEERLIEDSEIYTAELTAPMNMKELEKQKTLMMVHMNNLVSFISGSNDYRAGINQAEEIIPQNVRSNKRKKTPASNSKKAQVEAPVAEPKPEEANPPVITLAEKPVEGVNPSEITPEEKPVTESEPKKERSPATEDELKALSGAKKIYEENLKQVNTRLEKYFAVTVPHIKAMRIREELFRQKEIAEEKPNIQGDVSCQIEFYNKQNSLLDSLNKQIIDQIEPYKTALLEYDKQMPLHQIPHQIKVLCYETKKALEAAKNNPKYQSMENELSKKIREVTTIESKAQKGLTNSKVDKNIVKNSVVHKLEPINKFLKAINALDDNYISADKNPPDSKIKSNRPSKEQLNTPKTNRFKTSFVELQTPKLDERAKINQNNPEKRLHPNNANSHGVKIIDDLLAAISIAVWERINEIPQGHKVDDDTIISALNLLTQKLDEKRSNFLKLKNSNQDHRNCAVEVILLLSNTLAEDKLHKLTKPSSSFQQFINDIVQQFLKILEGIIDKPRYQPQLWASPTEKLIADSARKAHDDCQALLAKASQKPEQQDEPQPSVTQS